MALEISELRETGKNGFAVRLSDGRELRASLAMVADLGLYSGRELSSDEVSELEGAARLFKCRERALRIIGARPMSCKELYDRLLEKGEDERDAAECVAWLVELHYLDDVNYAAMLVRHYSGKGYGKQRVKNELYRRGIDKALWDDALGEMPEMDDAVYSLLCRKLKSDSPDRAEMKRATDALFRRGYSWDEIKIAVNRYQEENSER